MKAIDVHGHCVPRVFLSEIAGTRAFGTAVEQVGGSWIVQLPGAPALRPIAGVMLDGPERIDWMADQGLAHQIVAPWLDVQGQELPAPLGRDWAALLNDALATSVGDSDGLLSAHATVHLGDAEAAATELRRAVTQLGMRGVMIPCSPPGVPLSDPARDPLWAAATDLGTPVVLHATTSSGAAGLLAGHPALRGLYARNIETTLVTAELLVTGVLDRFPDLRLVAVHGGGMLPYQAGRFAQDHPRRGERPVPELLRALYYDTVLMTAPALRFLHQVVGPNRIMLGSDFGATARERAGVRVAAAVEESAGSPAELEAVLAGTARSVFTARPV
ncbi:amidohydrolase family protein [Pseudonocardia sp. CA-107938]|uniref:amidohydrolase family protein n=1 Tax=Pseudonocardia sp. CA-107938 TaxID=3240021 RepID=UPI003D8A486D